MLDHIESTNQIELHSETSLFKVPLHQRAGRPRSCKCESFRVKIHPHNDSARTCLLKRAQNIAGSTPYFQNSVARAPSPCYLFRKQRDDPIPCSKPEMLIFNTGQFWEKVWIVGTMIIFSCGLRHLSWFTHKQTHRLQRRHGPDLLRSARYRTASV